MERYRHYQYSIFYTNGIDSNGAPWSGWVYKIYNQDEHAILIRESKEWFDSETQARFAAIGHISLLEKGEG